MNKRIHNIFFLLVVAFSSAHSDLTKCVVGGQGYPSGICTHLKDAYQQSSSMSFALLHGGSYNEKVELVKEIAKENNAPFKLTTADELVGQSLWKTIKNLRSLINETRAQGFEQNKRSYLVIGEIEKCVTGDRSSRGADYHILRGELSILLDKYKDDPYILIVGVTNQIDQVDGAILSRAGTAIIDIRASN